MLSSSSSSSQSEVTSLLSAPPSQEDSQHADETPCSQQDPLAQKTEFISELDSQPKDKEQANFPAHSDPQADSTASISHVQYQPENSASPERSQQHFTLPPPEVLVPDNDEDLLISPFESTIVTASTISSIVKEGTLYCRSKGLDNNPVEVLRYFQSKIVEGRALEIVDPSSSSEGETNLIYVDRNDILMSGMDEVMDEVKAIKKLHINSRGPVLCRRKTCLMQINFLQIVLDRA